MTPSLLLTRAQYIRHDLSGSIHEVVEFNPNLEPVALLESLLPSSRLDHVPTLAVNSSVPSRILGTSASAVKVTANELAFKTVYPGSIPIVKGVKAVSGISEQPFGLEETLRGARNRLDDARQLVPEYAKEYDIGISTENGIVEIFHAGQTHFIDLACILVEHFPSGAQVLVLSAGMEFPTKDVAAARIADGGFARHTVGSKIATRSGCDPQDPHLYLSGGRISRRELLVQGIVLALRK